jgi:hypothetical protein
LHTRATSFGTRPQHTESSFDGGIGGSSSRNTQDAFNAPSAVQHGYPRMSEMDAHSAFNSDNPLGTHRSMHMGGLREELERVDAANKPLPLPVNERDLDDEPLMSSRFKGSMAQSGSVKQESKQEEGNSGSQVIDNPLGPL